MKHLQTICENNEIFCKIVMSKSRVAPLKFVSVPQLELTAAKRGSKLMAEIWPQNWWGDIYTDNRVILSYNQNTKKVLKKFAVNRIHQIKSSCDMSQWHNLQTNENPANYCSRWVEMKSDDLAAQNFSGTHW